ncbi:hypothetical protein H8959_012561 [Pygathrix nigripes]
MQVARRPPLTPHKQTRRFRGDSRKTRLRLGPARCKVLSPPEGRHPRDGGENSSSALRQSATLPGGKLCGRIRSSHSGGASGGFGRRGTTEVRAGGAGPARPCEGGVAQSAASGTRGTEYPPLLLLLLLLQPPLPPPPPPPAPLAPVTLTRGFTLRS